MSLNYFKLNLKLLKRILIGRAASTIYWAFNNFQGPAPFQIKKNYLIRNGIEHAIWVETGTYLGETTKALAKKSLLVYSIEPADKLFSFSETRFRKNHKIELLHGTSEDQFPKLLSGLKNSINFWLDGHFSGDITFKGEINSPIITELSLIAMHVKRWDRVVIFIDDIRLFGQAHSGYPTLDYLVEWCSNNNFRWTIELDIFRATKL